MPTKKGNNNLMFRGNKFRLERTLRDGSSVWHCSQKGCPVYVTTRGTNRLKFAKFKQHCHAFKGQNSRKSDPPARILGVDEVPIASIWYRTDLTFYTNVTGKKCMRFRDYNYYRYERSGRTFCICCENRCNATATLNNRNDIKFNPRLHEHRAKIGNAENVPDNLPVQAADVKQCLRVQPKHEEECVQVKYEPVDLDLL